MKGKLADASKAQVEKIETQHPEQTLHFGMSFANTMHSVRNN